MSRYSLRRRLLLAFIGLATVPLLLAGLMLGGWSYDQNVEQAYARQQELARRVAVEAASFLGRFQFELETSLRLTDFSSLDAAAQSRVLARVLAERRYFRELAYLDATGRERLRQSNRGLVVAGEAPLLAAAEASRLAAAGRVRYGPVYYDPEDNEPMMRVLLPLHDQAGGQLQGMLLAEARLKPIWHLVASLRLAAGEEVYILDADGRVIAHRNPSVVLRETRFQPTPARRQPGLQGQEAFIATEPFQLGDRRLRVVAERQARAALAPAMQGMALHALVILVALSAAYALVLPVARRIARPITAVADAARAIRDGDLARRAVVEGDDEIGELAQAFNAMTDRLRQSLSSLENEVRQRTQAQQALEKLNRAYLALSMTNRAVSQATEEGRLLEEVCRIVEQDCGYRLVWIGLSQHDEARTVRPVASAGFAEGYLDTVRITWADNERGHGPTGTAIRSGRAVICRDILHNPDFAPWREQALRRGYASAAAFPIQTGGQILGALMVYADEVDAFTDDESRLLTELAENIGFGIAKLRTEAERRETEAHLAESRQLFQTVTQFATDWSYWRAEDRQSYYYMSPLCEAYTGYRPEDFQADPELLDRIVHPDDRARWDHHLHTSEPVGNHGSEEYRILTKQGELRWISHTCRPVIMEDGSRMGRRGSNQDITERKRSEAELERYRQQLEELVVNRTRQLEQAKDAAEAANRAKSVFLANMSHELRTPLNAILGFAQIMERDAGTGPEQRRHLETINRSGRHLLALINDVLEISRIEAGRVELQQAPFDLPETLGAIEEMIRVRAQDKALDFRVEYRGEPARYVMGDGHRLRQVLINLLGNAVKYTDRGGVRLRVRRLDGQVAFEVEDTGPGIPEEERERVFQAFYQTAGGIAKGEGTGLGLTISREYVRLMGGDIQVSGAPAGGSVFAFRIPLPIAPAPASSGEQGRVLGLAAEQPPPRVLVAEDHPDNREWLVHILEEVGIQVEAVENGRLAVERFQAWRPQFIWMDMRMPELDGYQATRRIRALPGGAEVRIVALTASAFREDREGILAAGCDDMVSKPVDATTLFQVMGRLLGLRYRHAEVGSAAAPPAVGELDLAAQPEAFRVALRRAAEGLDLDACRAIIQGIQATSPATAASLSALLEQFRFDRLIQLCESASGDASASTNPAGV